VKQREGSGAEEASYFNFWEKMIPQRGKGEMGRRFARFQSGMPPKEKERLERGGGGKEERRWRMGSAPTLSIHSRSERLRRSRRLHEEWRRRGGKVKQREA